jgi:type II secretory pathway pseudopilin PulG
MTTIPAKTRPLRPLRPRRGFFLIDSIVGFILIGALGLILVIAVTSASKAHRRLDDSAAATVAAEQAAALLRDQKPAPESIGEAAIKIQPAEGAQTVANHRWVQITATRNGRSTTLTALVPEGKP